MSNMDTTNSGKQQHTGPGVENVMVSESPQELHNSNDVIGQPDAGKFPKELTRRRFLSRMSIAIGGVIGVVTVAPVVGYLVAPLFKDVPTDTWRDVGAAYDFKVGETREVSFDDAQSVPWAGVTSKTAAWLRRLDDSHFEAFAVNCTHLGCPVSWLPSANLFECPCHGGVYYSDGRVAGGPPPKPLNQYEVRVNALRVEVRASGIPITD